MSSTITNSKHMKRGLDRGMLLCAKHGNGTTTRSFIVAWCFKLP